jgi:hypothetical protein
MNALRKALAAGYRARLVRAWNADCQYPILFKKNDTDFKNFEFYIGRAASRTSILADNTMSGFQKELSLNYVTLYGTQEAKDHYYATGELTPDNDKGVGTSHLALALDLIKMLVKAGKPERANMFQRQYVTPGYDDVVHLYNFYRYKHGSMHAAKVFKRKLWVVVLLEDTETMPRVPALVHVLNGFAYPLKFIPRRSVLKMPDYKIVSFRVGSIYHGFKFEFQIPKKFSFNEA